MKYSSAPDYLKAADLHNVADQNTSFFDDVLSGIESAPKFVAVSLASGLNSIYNSGVAIGNIFLSEDQKINYSDTHELISSFDDDLGLYYKQNKEAADLVGFVGSAFIPGTLGVKGLKLFQSSQRAMQAAAAGEVGNNISLATRLLVPSMETYVKREAADLAAKSATFKLRDVNTIKAIAAGTHQAVLETAAFETAVAATMFKSPIFNAAEAEDVLKNAGMGLIFGAGFGLIGSGARTYFDVNKLIKQADARANVFAGSSALVTNREADKIIATAEDIKLISEPVKVEAILAAKKYQGESGYSISAEAIQAEASKLESTRQANLQKFNNELRISIRTLVGDDASGNQLADLMELNPQAYFNTFFNLTDMSKLGSKTEYDKTISKLIKSGKTKEEAKLELANRSLNYITMHSGNIGQVTDQLPGVMKLADKFDAAGLDKFITKQNFKVSDQLDFREINNSALIEARWIWARKQNNLIWQGKKLPEIGAYDLPLIDKALRDKVSELTIKMPGGELQKLVGREAIQQHLFDAKFEILNAQKANRRNTDFLELVSDVKRDGIEGLLKDRDMAVAMFAQEAYAKELSTALGKDISALDLHYRPKTLKAVYDTDRLLELDGNVTAGMNLINYRAKLYQQGVDAVFADYSKDLNDTFIEIPDSVFRKVWRGGTGQGIFTNAGGSYNSAEALFSVVGNATDQLTRKKIKDVENLINPVGQKLLNSSQDAIRFSTINEIVASTPELYVLNDVGDKLILKKLKDYEDALVKWEAGGGEGSLPKEPTFAQGTREEIPLENDIIKEAVLTHITVNGTRISHWSKLHAAVEGNLDRRDPTVFRPIRPDPRDYKFTAIVSDESLVGVGHKHMLFATSADELENQMARVRALGPQYKIITRNQAEDYYRAVGDWTYEKTLHENYIDTDLKSRGIMNRLLPITDPQKIVNNWLQEQVSKENALVKEMILSKYAKQVKELTRLGELFADVPSSIVGRSSDVLFTAKSNPYFNQVKSMLNISRTEELGLAKTFQQKLDSYVSQAWNTAQKIFTSESDINIATDKITEVFDSLGFKSAYYDAAMQSMVNSSVPRGVLTSFVRKSNAFLTTTILRLDTFNSVNTMLGNSILYSTELKNLTRSIQNKSQEAAGELANLGYIKLVGKEDQLIKSPLKLMATAQAALLGPERKILLEEMRRHGFVPDLTEQLDKALDAITLTGKETVKDINKKLVQLSETWHKFAKQGEKWTGNTYAEQHGRLLAATTMKLITDIAVKHGVIDSNMAWGYINTFVNRTGGVIRAAERPLMFQGPIGQLMGLFQSYQFNLIQQTLRYIGEGSNKSIALLAGLQSSIYGASSLPGFNLINTSLVGNAAGNTEHKDIYSATNLIFGKTGADWLMFGAPSNVLRASLYTRGDTNPRVWHVVPNPLHPEDLPAISAWTNVTKQLYGMASKVSNGAPIWESFVSGIEHSGLSRPLAGLAAVSRGLTSSEQRVISTQKSGNILGSNDLYSLATLTRLAGAKPIDDAIITNAYFRNLGYASSDRERRNKLGTALRAKLINGDVLAPEDIEYFALEYAKRGGSQKGFNQWMMNAYLNTNKSRAQQLAQHLSSPYARRMQEIMGGRDYMNQLDDY